MARLEALLTGTPGDRELRLLLELLDPGPAGTFTWLDPRNASLALLPQSAAVPVQVLLELRGRNQLGVLAQLQALIPDAALTYRSDRDGPLQPIATSR